MPPTSALSSSLTITNPLHLYRTHLATSRLLPDPHQHRAALILQSVYKRLLDYTPPAHLNTRLNSLARALDTAHTPLPRRFFPQLLSQNRDSKHLIRVLTTADHALELDTPQGLLLSGEVGTGKSMLLDLLYHSLPTASKKRWHFHAFMLHIISSLEAMRRTRTLPGEENEYSLLRLARATVLESPVLFLDEFQMPDRAAAKLVSGLLVGFWGMGGVLVGSSNRRAEDLVQGAGAGREREFDGFLKALGRRCQFWDMGGGKDWRREARGRNWWRVGFAGEGATVDNTETASEPEPETLGKQPAYYFTTTSLTASWDAAITSALKAASPTSPTTPTFAPASLTIYTRTLPIPHAYAGNALFTFTELCAAPLGPADYITLTSHYHTLFITDIPPLTHANLKNEARRFITLLDAIYESGVRLAIRTSVESIDDLFFPDTAPAPTPEAAAKGEWDMSGDSDPLSAEVYAEAHQDLTAPFRPNIVAYGGTGRSEAAGVVAAPDFGDARAWTGEDERFAWRRAVSRLWEVTGEGWWGGVEWRPPPLGRGWEGTSEVVEKQDGEMEKVEKFVGTHGRDGVVFSPFRKHPQEPPRFGGEHFWSVVRWGRRAGNWGKGVEGVKERKEGGSGGV
ncbi:mitochondrial ATPase [Morchella snyderi]|nr:mitochondrial ATPase [Morchella snyderi]